jgi:hypothetical protein
MARIIDLDIIAPEGVTIRKGGVDYPIPGDPPTELWLALIAAHDEYVTCEGAERPEALRLFHDRMLAIFQLENPELEALPFGPAGMFSIINGFYGADPDEDDPEDPPEADEAPSTTTTKPGSASSAAKKKTTASRSRSSRSSAR